VSRTGGTLDAASITVAANGGTATQGADYTLPANMVLTWANGEGGEKSINVTIVDDASPEAAETVTFALTNATGATTGSPAQATLTLNDNDGGAGQVLQFSSAAASISESAGTLQLTVARTGSTTGQVTVNYATSNGTAMSGSDYVAATGTLTFTDGEQSKPVTITITNDSAFESDETFTVALSSPSGAALGANAAATVTISNDDAASGGGGGGGGSGGGGGGGGSFGALMMALGLLLTARGRRERARA
jgi:chitinase